MIAIGTDPSETEDTVRSYRDNQGITYRMVVARTDIVRAYNITTQSSKVGVDRNGVVQVRSGPGTRDGGWWQDAFNTLTEQPAASTAPSGPQGPKSEPGPTENAASVPASPPSTPLVRATDPDPEPTTAATAEAPIRDPTATVVPPATATSAPSNPSPPPPTNTPEPPPPTPTPPPTATPIPTATPVPPPPATEAPSLKVGYNVGEMAPDFELTTIDGETLSLSDFRGSSPVLLYFYATW